MLVAFEDADSKETKYFLTWLLSLMAQLSSLVEIQLSLLILFWSSRSFSSSVVVAGQKRFL